MIWQPGPTVFQTNWKRHQKKEKKQGFLVTLYKLLLYRVTPYKAGVAFNQVGTVQNGHRT